MLNFGNKEFRNLQEQVLKNAQDIETLKGREDLQIVIVNELPAVGNPNYIYLVAKNYGESPDVYDEYIWLENEQRYEKIGGVSIDLTNYVTLDTEQTITGTKSYTTDLILKTDIGDSPAVVFQRGTFTDTYDDWKIFDQSGYLIFAIKSGNNAWSNNYSYKSDAALPLKNQDLGSSSYTWKDIYLSRNIYFSTTEYIQRSVKKAIDFYVNNNKKFSIEEWDIYTWTDLRPANNNAVSLGSPSECWKDLYVAGNISDGVNTISVANIASKVTSTVISGTFDANGESTTEQQGMSEGLYIFTYGNCQCFLRLTATMLQNADTAPIRVSCPMISSGATSLGWLNISRSGDILTITITDGTKHVDSGYAWTLTKTNLL